MAVKTLVVDDNEINAMLIHDLLEGFSIDSDIAESGEQAIDMVSNNDYIFVLMDYVMPEMDGIEATKIICRIKPLMRIYAMTGDLGSELLHDFMNAGATGALTKPIKLTELFDIIRDNLSESEYTIPDILREKYGDGGDSGATQRSGEIDLKAYLEKVPQLDYNTGLSNIIGNTEAYKRLLRASIGNIREYSKVLRGYPDTTKPDQVRIALHSLKSVFANIGIESLRLETALMEKISVKEFSCHESERTDGFRIGLDAYLSKIAVTLDSLEDALSEYETDLRIAHEEKYNRVAEKPLSDEEFDEVLKYTYEALERFEVDFVLEGLDHLKKAMKGDTRRSLEKAIDAANEFDYDIVKEIVDAVAESRKSGEIS
ncbi:MAG: response regulator [Lachnospiraceae bacterium]|nr:response regulator [Lachnospiraceae bacterium]